MTKFILNWNGSDKKREVVEGVTIAVAFSNAGYSAAAIRALDYYNQVPKKHSHKSDEEILSLEPRI